MLDPRVSELSSQFGIDPALIEAVLSSLLFLTVLTLVTAVPTWILAGRKRRSKAFWLVFALSIPVLPLLLIWLLPALPAADQESPTRPR